MTPSVSPPCRSILHGIGVESVLNLDRWPALPASDPCETWSIEVHRAQVTDTYPIELDLEQVRGTFDHSSDGGREQVALTLTIPRDGSSTRIHADFADRTITAHCDIWFPGSEGLLVYVLQTRVIPALAALTRDSAVLHATAVHLPEGAIVVCGPSGAGKSSLAAGLVREGGLLIGDEPVIVDSVAGGSIAQPSVGSLRLDHDNPASAMLSAQGWLSEPDHQKTVWSPPASEHWAEPSRVAAILVLGDRLHGREEPEIAQLAPVEAVQALMIDSLLPLHLSGARSMQFRASAAIVQATPVFRVSMPDNIQHLPAAVTHLRRHIRGQGMQ